MMKMSGFIITVLMLASNVIADTPTAFSNLTISAVETASTLSWSAEKATVKKAEKAEIKLLTESTDALNEKLNAKLEQRLEAKFSNQLDY